MKDIGLPLFAGRVKACHRAGNTGPFCSYADWPSSASYTADHTSASMAALAAEKNT